MPYHAIPLPYHTIPCHTLPYPTMPYHAIPLHLLHTAMLYRSHYSPNCKLSTLSGLRTCMYVLQYRQMCALPSLHHYHALLLLWLHVCPDYASHIASHNAPYLDLPSLSCAGKRESMEGDNGHTDPSASHLTLSCCIAALLHCCIALLLCCSLALLLSCSVALLLSCCDALLV